MLVAMGQVTRMHHRHLIYSKPLIELFGAERIKYMSTVEPRQVLYEKGTIVVLLEGE